jgi:subtilisin family serine protease
MKKNLFFLVILLAIAACTPKHRFKIFIDKEIPDQYIVFMKESFEEPVINHRVNNPNRNTQKENNKPERDRKERKLVDFLREKGISNRNIHKKFVDVKVGAVVKITAAKAAEIRTDTRVEDVIQDIVIQINPIQQSDPVEAGDPNRQWRSDPVIDINPIQQSDALQLRYDINPTTHMTHAVSTAGGSVPAAGKTTVLWFLDTGIDPTHPNLNVKRDWGASFVRGNTNPDDDNGHGTFCAGVAAGRPVGITPQIHIGISEDAVVVPVKVLDNNGKGSWGWVMAGLNHVAQLSQPGDVVNLSLGSYDAANTTCYFPAMKNAFERITTNGVFVTLSAGNDAGNASCNRPGCIDATNVFTASSINADSTCAVYANFGTPVDFVTVGTRVFSTWYDHRYRMASGTSVSSALLAGIIHAKGLMPAGEFPVTCAERPYKIAHR